MSGGHLFQVGGLSEAGSARRQDDLVGELRRNINWLCLPEAEGQRGLWASAKERPQKKASRRTRCEDPSHI